MAGRVLRDGDGVPFTEHNRARYHRLLDGTATPVEKAWRQEQINEHAAESQAAHTWRESAPADWLDDVPDFDQSQGMDPGCGRT